MKLLILTTAAVIAAGAAQAQSMSGPATPAPGASTSAPAPTEPMNEPMAAPSSGATTGNAMASDPMTEQMARTKLSGAGYGSVSGLKRNADGTWDAMTKKGSTQQRVTVTADGTVTPKAPM